MWADAHDDMSRMDRQSSDMSTDQRLKLAKVKALLAIAEELSALRQQGINPQFSPAGE
jgi:hypothetical protein